ARQAARPRPGPGTPPPARRQRPRRFPGHRAPEWRCRAAQGFPCLAPGPPRQSPSAFFPHLPSTPRLMLLGLDQARIVAGGGPQLLVRPTLDDATAAEHNDFVAVPDRAEPVRHQDARTAALA